MWKIERKCPFGLIGEDEFYTFEEAKIQFRNTIKEKLGDGIAEFTNQIDEYCEKYYPDGAPNNFEELKNTLIQLVTNPDYPENPDEFEFEDFEDDNIEFYIDSFSKTLFIYINNDDITEEFPQAEINIIKMNEPDDEYYFYITDNRNQYSTDITLKPSNT